MEFCPPSAASARRLPEALPEGSFCEKCVWGVDDMELLQARRALFAEFDSGRPRFLTMSMRHHFV